MNFILPLLLVVATVLVSASAYSDTRNEYCSYLKDIAKAAMTARQAGLNLEIMRSMVQPDDTTVEIVNEAYRYARLNNPTDQQTEIDRFTSLVLRLCLNGDAG